MKIKRILMLCCMIIRICQNSKLLQTRKALKNMAEVKCTLLHPLTMIVMKKIPYGKVITVGKIREYFAKLSGADFTEPITAGIFVSIVAWASYQRSEDETPYWRTLKANGELNPKYPNGIEAQKKKLEDEGHIIIQKGRKNIRYYVKDYEKYIFDLSI